MSSLQNLAKPVLARLGSLLSSGAPALILAGALSLAPAQAETLTVNCNDPEPGQFATIQDAMAAAVDNDRIELTRACTYSESVTINGLSGVVLVPVANAEGEQLADPIIDSPAGPCLSIRNSRSILVTDVALENCARDGLSIRNSDNLRFIRTNIFRVGRDGIHVRDSTDIRLVLGSIGNAARNGVRLNGTTSTFGIEFFEISNNDSWGVFMAAESSNNDVRECTISGNGRLQHGGVHIRGLSNQVRDSTFSLNSEGETGPGIFIAAESTNATLSGNTLTNGDQIQDNGVGTVMVNE